MTRKRKSRRKKKLEDALRAESGINVPIGDNGGGDARLTGAVKSFQLRVGLPLTGRMDKATQRRLLARHRARAAMKAVGTADRLPNTVGMDEEERFFFYVKAIAGHPDGGALISDLSYFGRRVILGLRVETPTWADKGKGLYDDRIVILWRTNDFHVREFEATTDPSSRYEDGYKYAKKGKETKNDANPPPKGKGKKAKKGRGDLGRLPHGKYKFERSKYGKGNALRPMAPIIAERDTDHDGYFDPKKDVVTRPKALNSGKSILFHAGGTKITGSAACQTMPPAIFRNFWKHLGKRQQEFNYLLMPADSAFKNQLVISNTGVGALLFLGTDLFDDIPEVFDWW